MLQKLLNLQPKVCFRAFSSTVLSEKLQNINVNTQFNNGLLSDYEINTFHKQGYVLNKNIFTDKEKQDIVTFTNEISSWKETAHKWMQYFEEDPNTNERILTRTDYHCGLNKLYNGKLKEAVSVLFGNSAVIYKEKLNFKLPNGGAYLAHQDSPAYTTDKNIPYHITAMICADNSTLLNGCLYFMQDSNYHITLEYLKHNKHGEISSDICKKYNWEAIIANIGDVLIFHSFVPHYSNKNKSNSSRRAHFITYNDSKFGDKRNEYFTIKRTLFPPQIERIPGKDYSSGGEVFNLGNPVSNTTK